MTTKVAAMLMAGMFAIAGAIAFIGMADTCDASHVDLSLHSPARLPTHSNQVSRS